jgi:hypothetical protein
MVEVYLLAEEWTEEWTLVSAVGGDVVEEFGCCCCCLLWVCYTRPADHCGWALLSLATAVPTNYH